MDENGRNYLHEFMTGQRPVPKPRKWLNRFLWIIILGLLGLLAYLLIHG